MLLLGRDHSGEAHVCCWLALRRGLKKGWVEVRGDVYLGGWRGVATAQTAVKALCSGGRGPL